MRTAHPKRARLSWRQYLAVTPLRQLLPAICLYGLGVSCVVVGFLWMVSPSLVAVMEVHDRDLYVDEQTERPYPPLGLLGADAIMYRYTPDRIGVAAPDAIVKTPSWEASDKTQGPYFLEWVSVPLNKKEYGASKSTPIVTKDGVYIGTDTGKLVKLDRKTGKVLWSHQCRKSGNGIHSSAAIAGDMVYVGSYDGYLYCVNAADGRLIWEYRCGSYIGATPVLYGDTVFIAVEMRGPNGHLVGLNRHTGKELFRSKLLRNYCHSSPAIDAASGLAFVGDNSARVYCFNISRELRLDNSPSNRVDHPARDNVDWLWEFDLGAGGDVKSTPAVHGDVVYFSSWDHSIYAADKRTGRKRWSFQTAGKSMSSPSIDASRNLVVVGSHDRHVYGIDAATGRLRWKAKTEAGQVMSSAALVPHQGVAVIGSGNGPKYPVDRGATAGLYVIDTDTGGVIQTIRLRSPVTGQPTVVGSYMYAFDFLGHVYAFSA